MFSPPSLATATEPPAIRSKAPEVPCAKCHMGQGTGVERWGKWALNIGDLMMNEWDIIGMNGDHIGN